MRKPVSLAFLHDRRRAAAPGGPSGCEVAVAGVDDRTAVSRPVRQVSASPWAAYVYLTVGAMLALAYFFFPAEHLWLWAPLGLSAAVATVWGARRHRPRRPAAWYLIAAGLLCFVTGDTVYNVLTEFLHQEDPYPSLADGFYLAMYPLVVGGLVTMIRARTTTRDRAAMLDALTVATGMGLLSWVYLISPYLEDGSLSWQVRVTSVSYPIADIAVLATLARLAATGLRIRSLQLLVTAGVGLLVADVAYGWIQLNGEWTVGGPVDAGWVICYLAFGVAALHPSMLDVSQPQHAAQHRLRLWQIVALGAVSLVAPGVLAVEAARGRDSHPLVVAVFSATMYVLVICRLAGIVSSHQQSVSRERVLRRYGETLVSASTSQRVHDATVSAIAALVVGRALRGAGVYLVEDGLLRRHAGLGPDHDALEELWALAVAGGGVTWDGTVSVSPLRYDDDVSGFITASLARQVPAETHLALSTVAAQAALALESLRLSEQARRQQQDAQFKALIQNASDVLVVVDADGQVAYGSPSLERRLGWTGEALIGHSIFSILTTTSADTARRQITAVVNGRSGDRLVVDWVVRHAEGDLVSFEVVIQQLLEDPNVAGIVLTMRDVSERRELERRLTYQAFHDSLTGLANRSLFHDKVEHALTRLRGRGGLLAMLMLDLDDFKLINDTLGHSAGDEFLVAVSGYLADATPDGGTVARLGGDEFAILLEDLPSQADAQGVAETVISHLADPFVIQGSEVRAGVSCGLATVTGDDTAATVQELLRHADLALYEAKQRGRGIVVAYYAELEERMRDKVARKSDLRRAIDEQQFVLRYQPIVDMATGRISGAEALVRWAHPSRGIIGPGEFIPAAEESGLIVDLGRWILAEATAQTSVWSDAGVSLRMSVNVSPRQLQQADFLSDVTALLSRYPQVRNRLVLEITESTIMQDGPAIPEQMEALHRLGVLIAIDDFGVGYSSLGYLQRLPIDILKIDKSFVDNLGRQDGNGGVLAHAVVSLAHALRLQAVAEGIEQPHQRDELRALGCDYGQGYLFSRPLPPEQFEQLILPEYRRSADATGGGQDVPGQAHPGRGPVSALPTPRHTAAGHDDVLPATSETRPDHALRTELQ